MNLTNEVKVGIFTIVGMLLIFIVISFLGLVSFIGMGYGIDVSFDQVKGLKPDNVVRYAGVDIGRIKDINFNDKTGKVDVRLNIEKKYKIPVGARFMIGSDGLLGEKFIDVAPPKHDVVGYLEPNAKVVGAKAGGIDDFIDKSAGVLEKLELLVENMNTIFGDKQMQASLKETVVNLDRITKNVDNITLVMSDVLLANQDQLSSMITQMNATSVSLNRTMARVDKMLGEIDNDGATGANIAKAVENIAKLTARVDNIAKTLENVATDPKTEGDLKGAIVNVKQASEKANKMLDKVRKIRVKPDISFGYSGAAKDSFRTDLNVRIDNGGSGFLVLGGSDLTNNRRLTFQAGNRFDNFALRMGAMYGEAGIGVDYQPNDNFKLFAELYDTHEHKVSLGAEYQLNKGLYLMAQSFNIRKDAGKNTYFGVKQYF